MPLRLGVFGLTDVGRVFLSGESSERWHSAVGGGVWVSLAKPENTPSLAFAHSEGHLRLYFQGGFTF